MDFLSPDSLLQEGKDREGGVEKCGSIFLPVGISWVSWLWRGKKFGVGAGSRTKPRGWVSPSRAPAGFCQFVSITPVRQPKVLPARRSQFLSADRSLL